jgi:hypothetical protein
MEIKRNYFKWNINEVLRLQREYELLGMTIHEIAESHSRSGAAILCKLEREGFIENWALSRGIEEFIDSDSELCKYKSLILDGNNLNSKNNEKSNDNDIDNDNDNDNDNNNNCEVLTSLCLSSYKMESSENENIENLKIINFFQFIINILCLLFQFIDDNFTKKMIF